MFAPQYPIIGLPQQSPLAGGVSDTTPAVPSGTVIAAVDPWWGAGEFLYAKASGAIRQKGLCHLVPAFDSTLKTWRIDAVEAANTANMGRPLAVAMMALADTKYGWFQISGITPVNCSASVAADTTFAIAATGQGGALGNGKQVLNARIVAAAAATVAKANCSAPAGAYYIDVPDADGWFPGVYLSGTGVGSGAKVVSVDAADRRVTVDVVSTAAIAGTVTATYNNSTIYYNVAHLNRPFAQGQTA
jgi:hypothetical protein